MANISNNTFENLNLRSKISKLEDSKMDQYVLRKHISYSIPNTCIPNMPKLTSEIPIITSLIPSIKQNAKSQVEELQKLHAEINSVEEKIKDLELTKKLKLTKIEDLRCIIERIADEECFDCGYSSRPKVNQVQTRERLSSSSSSKKRSSQEFRGLDVPVRTDSLLSATTTTSMASSSEEAIETEGEGEGAKCGINYPCIGCPRTECDHRLLMQTDDRLQNCLLFWQEHLAAPKRLFKA